MNLIARFAAALRRAPKAEVEPPGGAALWIGSDGDPGALARGADEWRGSGLPEAHLPTRSAGMFDGRRLSPVLPDPEHFQRPSWACALEPLPRPTDFGGGRAPWLRSQRDRLMR
jgi:hypothetical protein